MYRAPEPLELPLEIQVSPKSYTTAVILSATLGFAGAQHLYLRRWPEAILDLGLTLGWIACFARGDWLAGAVLLLLDLGHSITVTILLLTGNMKDGSGRVVCYPGQKLRARTRG